MEVKRREFLKILGASTAGATLAGCVRTPPESLIPYLVQIGRASCRERV